MMLSLYNIAVTLATPLVALWLILDTRRRPLLARFRPHHPNFHAPPLWVHACSVGELTTARPIIKALYHRYPNTPILLTVSTPTAKKLAGEMDLPAKLTWFPFDNPLVVRRFISHLRPKILILIETELWPSIIAQTHASGAPILLVNGRLSDAHISSYQKFSPIFRPTIQRITAAGMQNQAYADRLQSLGATADRLTITGNIKFDSAPARLSDGERATMRAALQIEPNAPVLVFGSTRPGDEALAAQCWRDLKPQVPGLVLIVAPRHLERLAEARQPFHDAPLFMRSQYDSEASKAPQDGRVIFLDTHGELSRIYAIANIAIVGGSFYPGVDGHNPIEPAAQGVPTLFGPYMRNFQDPANALLESGGALQVDAPEDLSGRLESLLTDADAQTRLGENAIQCVQANQGALQRTLALIENALSP